MAIDPVYLEELIEQLVDADPLDWDRVIHALECNPETAAVARKRAKALLQAPPDIPVGKELEGKTYGSFHFVRQLGKGGFGEVWLVFDTEIHRWVALKFLHSRDDEHRQRLREEARASARLRHANIVRIHNVAEIPELKKSVIVMELCWESSNVNAPPTDDELAKPLASARRTSSSSYHALAQQARTIALAVAEAHRSGVVHGDLKPENVLVTPKGSLFVTDFGLGNAGSAQSDGGLGGGTSSISTETSAGKIHGTPCYMSPEQAAGKPVTKQSDVYSLGATLFFLLTGRPPFSGDSDLAIIRDVASGKAPALPRRIPRGLRQICAKAMSFQPVERYENASQVAQALQSWLTWRSVCWYGFIAVLLAVAVGVPLWRSWMYAQVRNTASTYLAEIGSSNDFPVSEKEAAAIRSLAANSEDVRISFLQNGLTSGNAVRLRRRLPLCLRAVTGLDPRIRNRVLQEVVVPVLTSNPDHYVVTLAALDCAYELGWNGDEKVAATVHVWTKCLSPDLLQDDSFDLVPLVFHLKSAAPALSRDQAAAIYSHIVAAMQKTKAPFAFEELSEALSVIPNLEPDSGAAAAGRVIAVMQQPHDFNDMERLAEAVNRIPGAITDEQADAAISRLLSVIESERNRQSLEHLGFCLWNIVSRLSVEQTESAGVKILSALQRAEDDDVVFSLSIGLDTIPRPFSETQSAEALAAVIRVLQTPNPLTRSTRVADAIKPVILRSSPAQASAAFVTLTAAVEDASPFVAERLTAGVRNIAYRLPSCERSEANATLVRLMQKRDEVYVLAALAAPLADSRSDVLPETKSLAKARIVEVLKKASPSEFVVLLSALRTLPGDLSAEELRSVNAKVAELIKSERDIEELITIGDAFRSALAELSKENQAALVARIVEAMLTSTRAFAIEEALNLLEGLAASISAEQLDSIYARVLGLLKVYDNSSYTYEALATSLNQCAKMAAKEQLWPLFERLIGPMRDEQSVDIQRTLASGLRALYSRLPEDAARTAASQIAGIFRQKSDPETLRILAELLGSRHSWMDKTVLSEASARLLTVGQNCLDPTSVEAVANGLIAINDESVEQRIRSLLQIPLAGGLFRVRSNEEFELCAEQSIVKLLDAKNGLAGEDRLDIWRHLESLARQK